MKVGLVAVVVTNIALAPLAFCQDILVDQPSLGMHANQVLATYENATLDDSGDVVIPAITASDSLLFSGILETEENDRVTKLSLRQRHFKWFAGTIAL